MHYNRMINTFLELVKVDSESKNEGKFHELLKHKLRSLGAEVFEDDTMRKTELGANNLLGRISGTNQVPPIFFACHSDTVKPGVGINPQIREGNIYSDGNTILGADDKAGIAVLLELVEQLKESGTSHRTIELIFSPGEEIGLIGANAFDVNQMLSDCGFVLDSDGPVGNIIAASPSLYSLEVIITGKAAHSGLEPEKGISAIEIAAKAISGMRLGRLDDQTTANIGSIHGGTAMNIVAEKVVVLAEARSISHKACENQIQDMIDKFEEAAREAGGHIEYTKDLKSKAFQLTEESHTIKMASEAIKKSGRKPVLLVSGGGSDANVFNAKGKETANISIGYEKVHTTEEYIPIAEMEKTLEVVMNMATNNK